MNFLNWAHLYYPKLFSNLGEFFNGKQNMLVGVSSANLNPDAGFALWNNRVVKTNYVASLIQQCSSKFLR